MFIAMRLKSLVPAPAEPNAARQHRAPLERGPRSEAGAIDIWPRRGHDREADFFCSLD